MKKYVFLTMSIEGVSGNPRYVNNKCGWLKAHGWDPIVFWSFDKTQVELEHTKPFADKKYLFHELNFYPSWFSCRKRSSIVDSIIKTIGSAEEIVIESNKLQLGAWGELIAKKLGVKHIVFVTTEKLVIQNQSTFDFCYKKLLRGEFFNINPAAIKHLFSRFIDVKEPEKYYWDAMMGVDVENTVFPSFDELPEADYTITHFGRTKGYFSYMIEELKRFITVHKDKRFNLFFLGQIINPDVLKNELELPNVHLTIHPPVVVVPKQIFTKSDIVIGTAGCALLSSNNGCKTIAMDVNQNVPLGLIHYTTLDCNTCSGKYKNEKSLSQWLESILIKKEEYTKMVVQDNYHDFDYQMRFVTPPDGLYIDSSKVRENKTRNDKTMIFLSKIGLFKLVDYFYFTKMYVGVAKN